MSCCAVPLPNAMTALSPGFASSTEAGIAVKIKPKWLSVRRAFKAFDAQGSGVVRACESRLCVAAVGADAWLTPTVTPCCDRSRKRSFVAFSLPVASPLLSRRSASCVLRTMSRAAGTGRHRPPQASSTNDFAKK